MKKIITLLVAVLLTATVWAQAPQKMSYQAVIRNSSNVLVVNTQIGMEIKIRQGSALGTVVYTETQTPTTNANGLVNIEIGGGAGFSTINWASDTYYIETNTAVVPPLTTYTISGTSQLLSVPYALHAKTAETLTGGITETDPVFGVSPANGITSGDITNWNNKLDSEVDSSVTNELQSLSISNDTVYLSNNGGFVKLPSADGSETKVTSGYGIILSGAGTTASPYNISTPFPVVIIPPAIGDSYQGGIIFWLDNSGEHGLIAATADQSTGIQWYNGTYTTTNAVRDGMGAGMYNTERIISKQGVGSYAAQLCANYQGGGYGDWYLPSKYELNLLYQQKAAVGGFANAYYWSSTEYTNVYTCVQVFDGGYQDHNGKEYSGHVRAIRSF